MNNIGSVTSTHQAAQLPKSSSRAAEQTAANAAHAARSGAVAQLSTARGQDDTGAIKSATQTLAIATAAVTVADASVKSDGDLNSWLEAEDGRMSGGAAEREGARATQHAA